MLAAGICIHSLTSALFAIFVLFVVVVVISGQTRTTQECSQPASRQTCFVSCTIGCGVCVCDINSVLLGNITCSLLTSTQQQKLQKKMKKHP